MSENDATPENGTMLQGFEWNCPSDQRHYSRLSNQLPALKSIGVNAIWLPPGCKTSSPERAKEEGVKLYWDAVLNHKAGADKKEKVTVVEVDENDRNKAISDPHEVVAWLGFEFAGRGDRYSKQQYHWYHFSGTDYDAAGGRSGISRIEGEGKGWSESVDGQQGNADFLMFADLDYSHPEVIRDVKRWGRWVVGEAGLAGFRLERRAALLGALAKIEKRFPPYDSPLLNNFSRLSEQEGADLRGVFDGTRGEHAEPPSCGNKLTDIVLARNLYAYGDQDDYFDSPNCIGV
ncbi:hypothetical protein DL769_010574 [Monosporascus sp. CRB-8-3]|nr:hypothetical protein DL769_010574 [Monosporascus sp. CRB-8-3]